MGGVNRTRRALAATAVLVAAGAVPACSVGRSGLGARACPYLRPRLVRLDRDQAALRRGSPGAPADIAAVAQDVALYVGQLPDAGAAAADRSLVRLSHALDAVVAAPEAAASVVATGELATAELAVKRRCGVT